MREIKFRIWNGREMEYNIMAGFLGVFYVQGMDEQDSASMSPFNTNYNEDTPVMQFTGLKDKNGSDICIYEGDIISLHGKVIGNKYENEELLKDTTNLLIEGLGTKTWRDTEKEAMGRGCHYSE